MRRNFSAKESCQKRGSFLFGNEPRLKPYFVSGRIHKQQRFSRLPLIIPFQTLSSGDGKLKVKLTVYYCREDNTGACLLKILAWRIPLKIPAEKMSSEHITLQETLAGN